MSVHWPRCDPIGPMDFIFLFLQQIDNSLWQEKVEMLNSIFTTYFEAFKPFFFSILQFEFSSLGEVSLCQGEQSNRKCHASIKIIHYDEVCLWQGESTNRATLRLKPKFAIPRFPSTMPNIKHQRYYRVEVISLQQGVNCCNDFTPTLLSMIGAEIFKKT